LSESLSLDVSGVGLAGVDCLAGELWAPTRNGPLDGRVFCCVPGGGMSRRYWNLRPPGADSDDRSYSMAEYVADRGGWVLALDPPGVGESPSPEDGWTLTPAVLADVMAAGFDDALGRLGSLRPIGVGHSMGALLTVHIQARHHRYGALALLGFASRGLPEALSPQELAYQPQQDPSYRELVELTRARHRAPLRYGRNGDGARTQFLMAGATERRGRAALSEARSALLAVAGLASMIPEGSRAQLEAIDVPVFLGVGEHDITGPSHQIPASFPHCNDITLFVVPDTGHNHNAADNRALLWERLVSWSSSL
jgi:pimeloyl-ACP methyl ester carboxylesterase